ncbi:MAG: DUF3124 domain-containing protein, partial [Snowella sp.]
YWLIAVCFLTSCSTPTISEKQKIAKNPIAQLQPVTLANNKIIMGQTIYVPIYSHIYHDNSQNNVINLSATLSIRNTDLKNSIIITAVDYYDTKGSLIRQYIKKPLELKALASTEVFIEAENITGGSGANFIIEWVATKKVSEPIIEAVMISTASSQGISFISHGKTIKNYSRQQARGNRQ